MKPAVFRGSGCALVTPMTREGKIRYDVFEKLIEYQIQNGTAALIACGSTGESASLTDVEFASCVRFVVKTAAGRVSVLAGSGGASTAHAVERSRMAQEAGADALLVSTPYYCRPPQAGLIRHFIAIADAVEVPIVLYNVPSRTGCTLLPETNSLLSEHPRIVALKEAGLDMAALGKTRFLCGDALQIYAGNDEWIAPIFSFGALGAISVLANLCPREVALLCESGLSGDLAETAKRQLALCPLLEALSCGSNPIPIKEALSLAGLPAGPCRLPLEGLTKEKRASLSEALVRAGLERGVFS